MLRSLGYGRKGDKGDVGATGPAGAAGAQGPKGDTGATGPQGATGSVGPQGPVGATGPAGSNATATPLGTALPKANGTANAGTSTNAAREDHVHPGLSLAFVANVTLTETLLVSLSVGMKRKDVALPGGVTVAATDKLVAVPNGTPTSGCEMVNAYPAASSANVSIGYYTPLLGIGATYTIPVTIYKVS